MHHLGPTTATFECVARNWHRRYPSSAFGSFPAKASVAWRTWPHSAVQPHCRLSTAAQSMPFCRNPSCATAMCTRTTAWQRRSRLAGAYGCRHRRHALGRSGCACRLSLSHLLLEHSSLSRSRQCICRRVFFQRQDRALMQLVRRGSETAKLLSCNVSGQPAVSAPVRSVPVGAKRDDA